MRCGTFLLVAAISMFAAVSAIAQTPLGTAFTYQGELNSAGAPARGLHDLRFRLFDAPAGGTHVGATLCAGSGMPVSR